MPFGKLELSFGVDRDPLETIPFLYIYKTVGSYGRVIISI